MSPEPKKGATYPECRRCLQGVCCAFGRLPRFRVWQIRLESAMSHGPQEMGFVFTARVRSLHCKVFCRELKLYSRATHDSVDSNYNLTSKTIVSIMPTAFGLTLFMDR